MSDFTPRTLRLLAMAALLAGCQTGPTGGAPATPRPTAPLAVETDRPGHRDVDRVVELPGDVRPLRDGKIYSKVSGHLKDMRVNIGDRVQEGQIVAVIEAPELERDVLGAQAVAARAESDVVTLQVQEGAQSSLSSASAAEMARAQAQATASQAEVSQAQARLQLNQDTYRRLKAVYDQDNGLIARQQLDQAWSELKVSESQLAAARDAQKAARQQARALEQRHQAARQQVQALASQQKGAALQAQARRQEAFKARDWQEYTNLRAPFSGVVTRRYLDSGALLQAATQPVLEVMDDRVVTVAIRVPEMEAPHVRPGRALEVISEALPEDKFQGRITRVAQALSSDSDRTMLSEADLPNPGHKLQPGMFVRCTLTLATHKGVVAVPSAAVLDEKGKTSVFVVEQGKAHKKPVKVGFSNPRWAEIAEGLSGEEVLVVKGKEALSDGSPVTSKAP